MKKTLSLLMVLLLTSGILPVQAGKESSPDRLSVYQADDFVLTDRVTEQTAFTLKNVSDHDLDITVEVYDQAARKVIETLAIPLAPEDRTLPFKARVYKSLPRDGSVSTYVYRIKTAGGFSKELYFVQRMNLSKGKTITYTQYRNAYFAKNTVSSFGPHVRDLSPALTQLWYMVTPIDLNIQGRQTVPLAAGNMYLVGEAYVDVSGDSVTVTYKYFHEDQMYNTTERVSEFLTFFNTYSDIQTVVPEEIQPRFQFGQPFSIAKDLGGDTNVLMFVRNVINYYQCPAPTRSFQRFQENSAEFKTLRAQMMQLMDPLATAAP